MQAVLQAEEPIWIPFVSISKVIILQLYCKLLLCNNKAEHLHFFSSAVVKTESGRDPSQLLSSFCSPSWGAAGVLLITRQSKEGFFCSLFADPYSSYQQNVAFHACICTLNASLCTKLPLKNPDIRYHLKNKSSGMQNKAWVWPFSFLLLASIS